MDKKSLVEWSNWIAKHSPDLSFSLEDFQNSENPREFLQTHKNEIRNFRASPEIPKTPSLENTLEDLMDEYESLEEIPYPYLLRKADAANVSVDELTKEYKNLESKKRAVSKVEEEAKAREQRRKELEDLPFYAKALMTEQAKKRFIDDPESSVFYQEKKAAEGDTSAHPWSKTWLDRAGVGLGAAGALADLLPGPAGVFIGPTIRGIRTLGESAFGDDDRSWKQILGDVASDYGSNIGVAYAPTAVLNAIKHRSAAMKSDLPEGWTNAIWEGGVKETAKKMKNDLNELNSLTKNALLRQEKIREKQPDIVKQLRSEGIRTQAEGNVERKFADELQQNTFGSDIKSLAQKEGISELDAAQEYLKRMKSTEKPYDVVKTDGKTVVIESPEIAKSYKENVGPQAAKFIEQQSMNEAIGKGGKIAYGTKKAFDVAGERAVKEFATASKGYETPKSKFDKDAQLKKLGLHKESKKDDYQNMLDKIIENTKNQWDAGFAPRPIPGDPTYEAYLKYKRSK